MENGEKKSGWGEKIAFLGESKKERYSQGQGWPGGTKKWKISKNPDLEGDSHDGISKRGNFDGLHKQVKNHFGIGITKKGNLMGYVSRSCDLPK